MIRRTGSTLATLAVGIAVCSPLGIQAADTQSTTSTGSCVASINRIRPRSAALAAAIRDATKQSVTFRRLVETINVSAGIVYLEAGDCGHGVKACLAGVTATASDRILWVRIEPRKRTAT